MHYIDAALEKFKLPQRVVRKTKQELRQEEQRCAIDKEAIQLRRAYAETGITTSNNRTHAGSHHSDSDDLHEEGESEVLDEIESVHSPDALSEPCEEETPRPKTLGPGTPDTPTNPTGNITPATQNQDQTSILTQTAQTTHTRRGTNRAQAQSTAHSEQMSGSNARRIT